eukprot:TRINITY_DN14359_c0_g1_i7.p1 TRINITY_DN14359_c0_g1~~TRINITY_DN14359_c0_g1_i7.p1  ORF type:complete len:233 (-),score=43.95 TRINITY_DN14359_c0_g1_i7:124-822(-)
MRPEEPMSLRDLARDMESLLEIPRTIGNCESVLEEFQKLATLYKKLLETYWDKRFKAQQFEAIALTELNSLLRMLLNLHEHHVTCGYDRLYSEVRHVLCKGNNTIASLLSPNQVDVDLRIVTKWANGEADVELHVCEPDGQKCYSMSNTTPNGGFLSCDCVGFGPEEYWIRKAVPGQYDIKVKLFSNLHKFQPIVVNIEIWTNFGRINQKRIKKTVVLKDEKEEISVLSVIW